MIFSAPAISISISLSLSLSRKERKEQKRLDASCNVRPHHEYLACLILAQVGPNFTQE
jgi:hypothetical protein